MKKKVIVLGLDGVPWPILNNLLSNNVMPNLKKIIEKSTTGILRSTIPSNTPSSWTSITTGVNPGKHGIFGFQKLYNNFSNEIVSSKDVMCPRIHELLASNGLASVVINLPRARTLYIL